jgi:hypothetical protein
LLSFDPSLNKTKQKTKNKKQKTKNKKQKTKNKKQIDFTSLLSATRAIVGFF